MKDALAQGSVNVRCCFCFCSCCGMRMGVYNIYIYIYIFTLLYRALCMRSATARAKVMHQVRSNVGTPAAPLALPMDGAAEPPRRRRRLAYEAASSNTQRLSAPLQRSAPLSAAHAVEDRFN